MAAPIIEIDRMSQDFPSGDGGVNNVVKEISFSVERPETICILGPSGCGKTTVLRVVSGMRDRWVPMPTRGEVRIEGVPVTTLVGGGAAPDIHIASSRAETFR